MYHAIIADDEEHALDELLYVIDWKKEDVFVDATAKDGEEAVQLIEQFSPDFVFCDINMPKKSGVDVLKFLKESGNPALFIAVSAYSDFIYVRECLDNGAFTYLLKTVDREELLDVLSKAKNKTDEHKRKKTDELYKTALYALMSNHDCLSHLNDLGFRRRFPLFTAVKTQMVHAGNILTQKDYSAVFLPADNATVVLVNHGKEFDIASYADPLAPCGVSLPSAYFGTLYSQADCALLSEKFFGGGAKFYLEPDPALIRSFAEKAETLSAKDLSAALRSEFVCADELCALYNLFTESAKADFLSYFDFAVQFESPEDFAEFLKSYKKDYSAPDEGDDDCAELVRAYILENYADNISVNMLSKKFFVSPGCLNRNFKKKFSFTVNKFLTDVRMNKAMELIDGANNFTLLKISRLCGYTDFYYFSRVFKKEFGKPPSYYKNQ